MTLVFYVFSSRFEERPPRVLYIVFMFINLQIYTSRDI